MSDSLIAGTEVLVVEDEPILRKTIASFLTKRDAEVTAVETLEEARNCLEGLRFDYALVDIHLPDGEGLELLRHNLFSETTAVVVMTAEGGVEMAVKAMKLGALDYLTKPFDYEELPVVFARCRSRGRAERLQQHQREAEAAKEDSFHFGDSLQGVKRQLEKILQADRRLAGRLPPVLIEGATGTGKTSIARWIHRHGPRSGEELVELNCSTLPENLAESELFGHERGAFTDAKKARIGLFEAADGGTLFLDEIPSLPPAIQAKVLTAVEDHKVRRVGGNKDIPINVRLIAATNLNLAEQVAKGDFREDLYHRLDLLRVQIPPLKERGEDVLRLADLLLKDLCKRYRIKKPRISERGKSNLLRYSWPGNVRELAHELERTIVLGEEGDLVFEHLARKGSGNTFPPFPSQIDQGPPPIPPDEWLNPDFQFSEEGFDLEEAINRLIDKALEQSGNNVSAAARLLGVSRDYVRYRLKKS